MTGCCLHPRKFQEGDNVCWVVGFRYSEVSLTFMGRGCVCVCTCVEPGPHLFEGCREQTLCTRVHQFPTAAEWCFWSKKRKKQAQCPFRSRAEPHMFSSKWVEVSEKQVWANKCQQVFSPNGVWWAGRSAVGKFLLPKKEIQGKACLRGWRQSPRRLSRALVITAFPTGLPPTLRKLGAICDPYHMPWVPSQCSRQDRRGGRAETRHPSLSRWQALHKTKHPKLILITALPLCPF